MTFFKNKPILRIIFIPIYILSVKYILCNGLNIGNIFASIILLFGCYITIVKTKIIKDKNADTINDYKFDIFNSLLTIVLLINILFP